MLASAPRTEIRPLLRGRAFSILFVAVLVAQASAILALNFVVDPRSEFPTEVFEPLTQSDRERKLRAIADMPAGPDALILGSSRAWGIPAEELLTQGYERPYNLALGAGTVTEALDAYRFLRAQHEAPRLVVLAFEDWQLYDVHRQPLQTELPDSFLDVRAYAPALARSLSYGYARDSLTALRYNEQGFPDRVWALDEKGDVTWERAEAARARGEDTFGETLAADLGYASAHYFPGVAVEPARERDLETLVATVRADGARMVILMTPMHPEALARLPAAAYASSVAHARELAVVACGSGAQVHDLSDPATYGSDLSGFVDGWHFTRDEGAKLIRHAWSAPDLCQQGL